VKLPTIYDFRIDVWLPDTLPMARLAEYLTSLAKVFGHQEQVHFSKVRRGSAIPEIHVQETAAPKVRARLKLVGTPDAPEDASKSVQHINNMLRKDGASAVLRLKGGAEIIKFPGCKALLAEEAIVHESGELIGTVIKVGGKDDTALHRASWRGSWRTICLQISFECRAQASGGARPSACGSLTSSSLKAGSPSIRLHWLIKSPHCALSKVVSGIRLPILRLNLKNYVKRDVWRVWFLIQLSLLIF
jgi:hypothetical protein